MASNPIPSPHEWESTRRLRRVPEPDYPPLHRPHNVMWPVVYGILFAFAVPLAFLAVILLTR